MDVKEILQSVKSELFIVGVAGFGDELAAYINTIMESDTQIKVEVLCENQNYLFAKTRIIDNNLVSSRFSFSDLQFENQLIVDRMYSKVKNHPNISIQICYIDIPIRIIVADNNIYVNNWITIPENDFKLLDKKQSEFENVLEFLKLIKNENIGQKFAAPFLDNKGNKTETIELYDENRIRRGIFPRSAFYDSGFIKLVVWVFIFDRKGRLLIHKRSENAKDNRDMWDKSVGGHADYINDIDTSRTVPREVIEELITNETNGSPFLVPNDDDVIFLGEWKPEKRYDFPFLEVEKHDKNWVYFKVPDYERTPSPRILPDGSSKRNEVIADIYLFLLSDETEKDISKFQNSDYKLLYPSEIMSAMQNSDQNIGDEKFENKTPKFTPDLKYAFNSKVRHDLDSFSKSIMAFFS